MPAVAAGTGLGTGPGGRSGDRGDDGDGEQGLPAAEGQDREHRQHRDGGGRRAGPARMRTADAVQLR